MKKKIAVVAGCLMLTACASAPKVLVVTKEVYVYPNSVVCPKPEPIPDPDSPSTTQRTFGLFASASWLNNATCYQNVQVQNAQMAAMRLEEEQAAKRFADKMKELGQE